MKDLQFAKIVVFVSSLVPLTMVIIDKIDGQAGADPAFYIMRCTGLCALIFLALSLAVTPLRRVTGKNFWSVFRRMLGLYAFFYAGMHLLTYAFMYKQGNLDAIIQDTVKRPFIMFGMAAFLIMVPLAATSTAWAVKKMGNKKWKLLHKLVYLSAIAGSIHYLMQGKAVTVQPVVFAAVLGGLLLLRPIAWARDKWFPAAKPARAPATIRTPAS